MLQISYGGVQQFITNVEKFIYGLVTGLIQNINTIRQKHQRPASTKTGLKEHTGLVNNNSDNKTYILIIFIEILGLLIQMQKIIALSSNKHTLATYMK